MSQTRNPSGFQFGSTGDATNGGINLSDITAIGNTFRNFIEPPTPKINNESKVSSKIRQSSSNPSLNPSTRGPDEIARKIDLGTNSKRPLISSEEKIKRLQEENLSLKIKLHTIRVKYNINDVDMSDFETQQQAQIKKLERELIEKDRKEFKRKSEMKSQSCQTKLDIQAMHQLFESRLELKRIREQEISRCQQDIDPNQPKSLPSYPTRQHPYRSHYLQQRQQQQRIEQQEQTQHQIMSQLNYPKVSPLTKPIATSSKQQEMPDEKKILEEVCRLNGILTCIKSKVEAKSITQ